MPNIRIALAIIAATSFAGTGLAYAANHNEPIQPIKAFKAKNPALVELGKKLYFDPRLSKSGFISCNFLSQSFHGWHGQHQNIHRT